MADWKQRQKRLRDVRERAEVVQHDHGRCRVFGCSNPARAATADGLDTRFCRSHADHHQRHGSPYKGSYSAEQVNPYRQAALAWLLVSKEDVWVRNALQRVNGLYEAAGQHVEAFRLRGLTAQERAHAACARLRRHEVDPAIVVAAWLAIELALQDDPQAVTTTEYRRVQAAKLVHRMASGTHKRWERQAPPNGLHGLASRPSVVVEELHVYPRSRGRVLRHLGEALEEACALLVEHRLEALRTFVSRWESQQNGAERPYPRGVVARKRRSS